MMLYPSMYVYRKWFQVFFFYVFYSILIWNSDNLMQKHNIIFEINGNGNENENSITKTIALLTEATIC